MKLLAVLALLFSMIAGHAARAEAQIVIKFSHTAAPNTPRSLAVERFKQLAESNTGGRVKVEIYPDSQLYSAQQEIEALQRGDVQMLAPSLSQFGAMGLHAFELFDLPFIFPSREILYRVTDGDIGKMILGKLSAKGMTGLTYWDNGYKQMSSNRPMHSITDLKGLKLRIQPSTILEAQIRMLGAIPEQLPAAELYDALQQGILDGTENPVSNFYTQGLYQVQKYLTISNHGYLGYAVVSNKQFWNDLPDDLRADLTKALDDATGYERDLASKDYDEALAKVIAAHTTTVYVLPAHERTAWQRELLPLYQQFDGVIGRYLIKSVASIAATVRQEKAFAESSRRRFGNNAPRTSRQ